MVIAESVVVSRRENVSSFSKKSSFIIEIETQAMLLEVKSKPTTGDDIDV